jgi:hypothetical protein
MCFFFVFLASSSVYRVIRQCLPLIVAYLNLLLQGHQATRVSSAIPAQNRAESAFFEAGHMQIEDFGCRTRAVQKLARHSA